MNAQEIIEQIKTLPPEEQQRVAEFVKNSSVQSQPEVRYADERQFREIVETVFEKHDELFRRLAE